MKKISYCRSLKVAHKVREELNKIVPQSMVKDMWIESWANCREQGLCFVFDSNSMNKDLPSVFYKAVVAEQRSSDSILIVAGNANHFNYQTNQPNEEIWNNLNYHKCFSPGQYKMAAEFILNCFKIQIAEKSTSPQKPEPKSKSNNPLPVTEKEISDFEQNFMM